MKTTIATTLALLLIAGASATAQNPAKTEPAAVSPARPPSQQLTPEMRRKLVDNRKKVSEDPQYQQLLKAAQAAQARADDYFLAKLKQAVAGDEQLVKLVDELIRGHQTLRAPAAP